MQVKHRHIESSFCFVEHLHQREGTKHSGDREEGVHGEGSVNNWIDCPVFVCLKVIASSYDTTDYNKFDEVGIDMTHFHKVRQVPDSFHPECPRVSQNDPA